MKQTSSDVPRIQDWLAKGPHGNQAHLHQSFTHGESQRLVDLRVRSAILTEPVAPRLIWQTATQGHATEEPRRRRRLSQPPPHPEPGRSRRQTAPFTNRGPACAGRDARTRHDGWPIDQNSAQTNWRYFRLVEDQRRPSQDALHGTYRVLHVYLAGAVCNLLRTSQLQWMGEG